MSAAAIAVLSRWRSPNSEVANRARKLSYRPIDLPPDQEQGSDQLDRKIGVMPPSRSLFLFSTLHYLFTGANGG